MPISDIPMFAMLRTRMQWHQERQKVLAENVANADTPNFRPQDLVPPDFGNGAPRPPAIAMMLTAPAHLSGTAAADTFAPDRKGGFQVHPSGNAVTLEDEMLKVAANQMDFATAATLYSRGLNLIKTALGKG